MEEKPKDRYLSVLLWALAILLGVFSTALFMLRGESNENTRDIRALEKRMGIHELRHDIERNDEANQ